MKKSKIMTLLMLLLVIPATLILGSRLPGRSYYFVSTLVIIEVLVPFVLAFSTLFALCSYTQPLFAYGGGM